MRVWIVTVVHDPQDARIAVRELGTLLEDGHEVTMVAPFSAYNRETPHASVHTVDVPRAVGRHRLAALRGARKVFREAVGNADLLVMHDPELLFAIMGQTRRLKSLRIMWDVHEDVPALVQSRKWAPKWAAAPMRAMLRSLVRWAERHVEIIVAEESYLHAFREPHPVVSNAVNIPDTVEPPSSNRVMYVGRVTAQRGALEMIELARRVRDVARVIIIGPADGDITEHLEGAAARGDLEWRGFMPNELALAELDGAVAGLSLLHDVPNYRHSLPTKLAEYGAHGVPIITTPNPSSVSFVEHLGAGVVVPFGDADSLETAVRNLTSDPAHAAALAQAGRATTSELFDWATASESFRHAVEGR